MTAHKDSDLEVNVGGSVSKKAKRIGAETGNKIKLVRGQENQEVAAYTNGKYHEKKLLIRRKKQWVKGSERENSHTEQIYLDEELQAKSIMMKLSLHQEASTSFRSTGFDDYHLKVLISLPDLYENRKRISPTHLIFKV